MAVTFREHRLDNGLQIIAEVDEAAHSSACGFFVKTGARDEASPVMGVSHFLEHMMFKGTDGLTAEDINRGFDEIGARNNAYTSNEMTCFHAQVLPEQLPRSVDLLARMMRPALRSEDFDMEKSVILEEIAMYRDSPFWVLYEATLERHYGTHGLGHRVLGTPETVGGLTPEQMRGYFDQRYSADNTVVSLAGRVDFDLVVDQLGGLCGDWPTTGATRTAETPRVSGETFTTEDDKVKRAYLIGVAPAPAVQDDRRYAAALLAQILGASDNSRLHWALVETGIADEAQAAFDPHDGAGEFFVYASAGPDAIEGVRETIEREIRGIPDTLAEDDLERLRNKLATSATLGGERPGDRMQRLGRIWTALGHYTTLEEELERITSVTLDDVRNVYEAFPLRPMTLGRLVPA